MSTIIDTNVLVRFFVGDNPKQLATAKTWFNQAKTGKKTIRVQTIVVAETCFVLESFYKQSRQNIAQTFEVFLSQRWLKVENRQVLLALWPWYKKGLHFVDSFLLSWLQANNGRLLTFDQTLQKQANRL